MAAAKKTDEALDSKEAPVTDKVSSIAQEALDRAADKASSAEESIRATAADTAETIAAKKEAAQMEMATAVDHARLFVVQNPLIAAAAAFTAGLVVTSLLSKRS